MKRSCALLSIFSLFLASLCSDARLMASHADVGVGTPTEVPLISFIWQDLFDETFDAGDDAMFIRSDKPASTTFGDGFELAVLTLDGEGDADHEYVGAVFVEESRYPVEDFPEQTGLLHGDYDGQSVMVQWEFYLDAVSGRIVNANGQSRIVAAYVYVFDFQGLGAYSDGGFRIENLIPLRRTISLTAADDHAFKLSGLGSEYITTDDCSQIDPGAVCSLELCHCLNRLKTKLDDKLDGCDSWGPWAQGLATGCGIGGAGAGAKAGSKRGGIVGAIIGTVVGACAGVVVGELTHQSWEKGKCRQEARNEYWRDVNIARYERFDECLNRDPRSFHCPVP